MSTEQPTVRLTRGVQQWLDDYAAARPRWDRMDRDVPGRAAAMTDIGRPSIGVREGAVADRSEGDIVLQGDMVSGEESTAADAVTWRVIREVRHVSVSEPLRTGVDIVAAVSHATGVAPTRVAAAIAYWAEHPDEVTARLHT